MTIKPKEKRKHKPKKHQEGEHVQPDQKTAVSEPSTKDTARQVEPVTKPTRR